MKNHQTIRSDKRYRRETRPLSSGIAGCLAALGLVLVLTMVPGGSARAQSEGDFQIWNALFSTADLSADAPGPSLWLDLHARRGETGTVAIIRPGAGLRITDWLSLWAGYAWVPTHAELTGTHHDEHRAWEQVILSHGFDAARITLQSRTRFEQRFGEGGSDLGLRVREFVRVNWSPAGSPVGLAFWDEVFVGLNDVDWGPRGGYDQNRLFLGLALPANPWARVETGYLLVHLNREPNQIVHALAINLFLSAAP